MTRRLIIEPTNAGVLGRATDRFQRDEVACYYGDDGDLLPVAEASAHLASLRNRVTDVSALRETAVKPAGAQRSPR